MYGIQQDLHGRWAATVEVLTVALAVSVAALAVGVVVVVVAAVAVVLTVRVQMVQAGKIIAAMMETNITAVVISIDLVAKESP